MKDYSWMKAVAFGKPLEHLKRNDSTIVCIARDKNGPHGSEPYLFSMLEFLPGMGSPSVIINLEETILGDFCISVIQPAQMSNTLLKPEKTIVAHFDYPPDYPKFRQQGLDLLEMIQAQGSFGFSAPHLTPFQDEIGHFTDIHAQ